MRAIVLPAVVLALAVQAHAKAGESCSLSAPYVRSEVGHNRLVTSLKCTGSADKHELPYPDGELFVACYAVGSAVLSAIILGCRPRTFPREPPSLVASGPSLSIVIPAYNAATTLRHIEDTLALSGDIATES